LILALAKHPTPPRSFTQHVDKILDDLVAADVPIDTDLFNIIINEYGKKV
jgi:hypothetical protein